ncbi:hypothetical protein ABIB35_001175 [Arthrobacter sp. UYP6]|uniref:hypothetical protein n=1 Tax=Arthrobacter sp. UYP6 TaxID=1756378 RepID=UPI003395EAF3
MAVGRHRADNEDKQVAGRQEPASAALVPPTVPAGNDAGLRPRGPSRRAQRTAHHGPGTESLGAESVGAGTAPAGADAAKLDPILPAIHPTPRKNHDLLFWGIFLAATAAGAMTWARVEWPVTAASSFLLLLAFTAVWKFSAASVTMPAGAVQTAPAKERRSGRTPQAEAEAAVGTSDAEAAMQDLIAAMSADAPPPTAAKAPITRKQMRAADPSTGVMPVVSVFSRKPTAGSLRSSGRTAPPSSSADPAVPLAPAGRVAKGIDTGPGKPGSRKARRRAEADALPRPVSKTKPADAPAQKPVIATSPGVSTTAPNTSAPGTSTPSTSKPSASAAAETASSETADSRWTRTFGPPETGQLPVQQYQAAAEAAAVPEDDESTERRQRSHSSH